MTRRFALVAVAVALVVWGRTALFAVDYAEFAAVTRFGAPIQTLDGTAAAGLHWKWPWPIDGVHRVDRRLQLADLPAVESLTRDAAGGTVDKTLAVDAFVTWRVPDAAAADRFVRTLGSPDQVRRVVGPRVGGRVAAAVGTRPLEALVAIADAATLDARTEAFRRQLLGEPGTPDDLPMAVLAEYGVEIVDVRVRRFRYPDAVRASIAERIRSERARKVAEYDTAGRQRAADILSRADADARTIEAQARADKQATDGRADAQADAIRNTAAAQDREFYQFLQKLAAYQAMVADTRDVLLLSTRHRCLTSCWGRPREPRNDARIAVAAGRRGLPGHGAGGRGAG